MLFYKILFLIFISINIWGIYVPFSNYYDEFITFYSICLLLFIPNKKKNDTKYEKLMVKCFMCVFLIGLFSTLRYHIQPHYSGIFKDCIAVSKFVICYYAFFTRISDKKKSIISKSVVNMSKFFIITIFSFALINLIIHSNILTNGDRYGLPIYKFLYSHETFLVSALVCMIAVIIANNPLKNIFYIVLGIVSILLTLKSKPILIVLFIVFAVYFKIRNINKIKKKRIIFISAILLILTVYLAYGQLNTYVNLGTSAARGAFYVYGLDIAINNFPFGSGFCSFASTLSHEYYSPLYYEYGMQYITGITEYDGSYAGDTFWPYIYAQYGFIGFLFYIGMIYYLFKSINNRFGFLSNGWIAAMVLLLYSLTASSAESFFTNDSAIAFAIILSCYIKPENQM